jgi:hypothetical protein
MIEVEEHGDKPIFSSVMHGGMRIGVDVMEQRI